MNSDDIRRLIRAEVESAVVAENNELRRRLASAEERILRLESLEVAPSSPAQRRIRSDSSSSIASFSSFASTRSLSPIHSPKANPGSSILQKVGAKVQRLIGTPPSETSVGPETVRRNSGLSLRLREFSTGRERLDLEALRQGLPFLRVTHNKRVQRTLRLDPEQSYVFWNPSKSNARILLDRICEVYAGEEARNYREEFRISAELAPRWVTIIHQRPGDTKLKALHMVMTTRHDFDVLIACLVQLVSYRREVMSGLGHAGDHFVDVHWSRSTNSDTRELSFTQVLRLCQQLHINATPEYVQTMFDAADADHSGFLDFDEFKKFVHFLKQRSDLWQIWSEFGRSAADMRSFLVGTQGLSEQEAIELWPHEQAPTEDEFVEIIVSRRLFPPVQSTVTKLDRPLNEYWVSSSHNTYLVGRQVADSSSVEALIRALQDGCRCLEIDCWDGAKGPSVYHGHPITRLTGAIEFDDVVEAIVKYGFLSSPYPIILSLEIRCGEANQKQMVRTLKTLIGGVLVTEPLYGSNELPSPDELKHRILIKVKSTAASVTTSGDVDSSSDEHTTASTQQVIPELAALGVYLSGRTFHGFETSDAKAPNHVFSFSERKLNSILRNTARCGQLLEHNRSYIARVYPSGYRILSTNFDPITFWRAGVQLVALNWQKNDVGMQINSAYFSPQCGYVLKPIWMRPKTSEAEIDIALHDNTKKVCLEVISAQQLPRPRELKADDSFNPHVLVEVYTGERPPTLYRTVVVPKNGFNPQFNYTIELQLSRQDYEFACIRFVVAAGEIPFAFHTCRLATFLPGYRHLPLQDSLGEDYIFSTLFVKLVNT